MFSAIVVTAKVGALICAAGLLFAWTLEPAAARWVRGRALPVAAGLFAFAMLAPSVWLVYLALAVTIPLVARSRAEAAAIYLVAVLSLPRLPRQIGLAGAYIFEFDKWLFGAIGLAIACTMLAARGRTRRGWFDLPFALAMVLEALLARGGNATSILRTELIVVLCYILPYLLVTRSLRRAEDVQRVLLAIGFCGVFLSAVGLFEARASFLVYETIGQRLGATETLTAYTHMRGGSLRAAGSFVEATGLGLFLATAFVTTMALRQAFRSQAHWLAALAAILAGLYATNARGPVVALAAGLLAYDLYRRRYGGFAAKVGAMALLYGIALLAAQVSPRIAERIGVAGDTASTTGYRQQLLTRGIEQIGRHPWTGVSVDQAYRELADLRQGEGIVDFVNGYVFYGMTAGVFGIAALLACFGLTAAKAWTLRRWMGATGPLAEAGGVVFAVAIMTAVACATTGFGGRQEILFYLVTGVGSALAAMRPRRRAQPAADATGGAAMATCPMRPQPA